MGDTDAPFKAALDIDPGDATARYYLRQICLQRLPRITSYNVCYTKLLRLTALTEPLATDRTETGLAELLLIQGRDSLIWSSNPSVTPGRRVADLPARDERTGFQLATTADGERVAVVPLSAAEWRVVRNNFV